MNPSAAIVSLKTIADVQVRANDGLISSLKNTISKSIEPAEKAVMELKAKVDDQVKTNMQNLNRFSVMGSQVLFGLSFLIIIFAAIGLALTKMCPNGKKATRFPFHLSWFLGWLIGLLNCIVLIIVVIIALSSIGGCDIVQKVQTDVSLWRRLKLPSMLETCV